MVFAMKTDTSLSVPDPDHAYVLLQQEIHDALHTQHPEWVQQNGESPICESYELRLAQLLGVPSPSEHRAAA